MAEFTITKWRCDRCRKVYDHRPRLSAAGTTTLVLTLDYDTAVGPRISWKELCTPCNEYVKEMREKLVNEAKETE